MAEEKKVEKIEGRIEPHKVTKPIQLLAAWLLGLVSINGSFLTAASVLGRPEWAAGVLVVASICNVPIFLVALFLMQTKFRPEMQEDLFYSKYLENRTQTGKPIDVVSELSKVRDDLEHTSSRALAQISQLEERIVSISRTTSSGSSGLLDDQKITSDLALAQETIQAIRSSIEWSRVQISVNTDLSAAHQILAKLSQENILVREYFGKGKPKLNLVSFDQAIEPLYVSLVFRALEGIQIDAINGFDPIPEFDEKNAIYIGSYAYERSRVVYLSASTRQELVSENLSAERLRQIISFG